MNSLKGQMRQMAAVFTDAIRLFARHWPALIALFCAGFALRFGALWIAGRVSFYSPTLTAMILPFAPLFMIAALALMLRVLATSLPGLLAENESQQWRSHIKATVVALIPFLAIYASNGFLKEDMRRYAYDQGGLVWAQLERGDFADDVLFDRIPLPTTGIILGIVVIAIGARKVIAWKKLSSRSTLWALLSAYLEAVWLTSLAYIFTLKITQLQQWVMSRQVVDDINVWWQTASQTYKLINTFILTPFTWMGSLISSAGALIVVPVAWLTIGATLYGAELKKGEPLFDEEVATERINRLPNPVQRTINHVVSPVVTPFKAAVDAIRKIAIAGFIPMVLFCVIFALTGWLRVGVDEVVHAALGPRSSAWNFAIEPLISLGESLVYFTVTLVLLAAGVSRVLSASTVPEGVQA
ncbi:MAG: hypothetical protein Q4P05_08305 [Actinomycetaceae bacterium]|nr:hypothetical protein [Actinomycetaceae bacterium]